MDISSSSSSSSDERNDPDYSESSRRRMQQNRSISKNKNKNIQIQMVGGDVGTSSGNSSIRRRLGPPPPRVRDEGLPLSLRRSTHRSRNQENKDNYRHAKRTILSWLIDTKVILEDRRIRYMDETREEALQPGLIKRDGIFCLCCHKIFTALAFGVHVGSDRKRPYENIFIEDLRIPLLSCLREAWRRMEEIEGRRLRLFSPQCSSSDRHDDACMVCADGGNLLCCEICPSTYHQDCMDMDVVPEGAWLCPYCVCKFCGEPRGANDYLVTCFQCEKKYHWECYQEKNSEPIDLNIPFTPLCEQSCKEVYGKLEKMVGVRKELDEGFSWTLLRQMDSEFGVWLSDLYERIECDVKLAVAKNVMEECFEPIVDRHTRINFIQNVMYNRESSYPRINFRGFYTAVLEKDEEIISVASLRIHGTRLAEMPLIATREIYRSQGMCRRLMVAIESALCYLKVENLVIPSTQERIGTWVERYGFQRVSPSLITELKHRNTVTFHDSFRLSKTLAFTSAAREEQVAGNNGNKNGMGGFLDLNIEPPKEEGEE